MAEPAHAADTAWRSLASAIGTICTSMTGKSPRISPGDRASLRRGERGPAFWKIVVDVLEPRELLPAPNARVRSTVERKWVAILSAVAHLAGQHDPTQRLGRVLGGSSRGGSMPLVSEARVMRLLRARGDTVADALRGVTHQLATSGRRVNLVDIAALALSESKDWGDSVRRRIALDYYRQHRAGASEGNRDLDQVHSS